MTNSYDPIVSPFKHIAIAATRFISFPTDANEIDLEAALINTARVDPDDAIVEIEIDGTKIRVLLDDGQEMTIDADTGRITRA